MARRLKRAKGVEIEHRAALIPMATGLMPGLERPGDQAPSHTH